MTEQKTRAERLERVWRLLASMQAEVSALLFDEATTPKLRTDARAAQIAEERRAELGLTPNLGPATATPSEALARYGLNRARRRDLTVRGDPIPAEGYSGQGKAEHREERAARKAAAPVPGSRRAKILEVLADGEWRSLIEIRDAIGGSGDGLAYSLKQSVERGELERRGSRKHFEYRIVEDSPDA